MEPPQPSAVMAVPDRRLAAFLAEPFVRASLDLERDWAHWTLRGGAARRLFLTRRSSWNAIVQEHVLPVVFEHAATGRVRPARLRRAQARLHACLAREADLPSAADGDPAAHLHPVACSSRGGSR